MAKNLLAPADLLPSWELSMRAERKARATIKNYGDGVRSFLRWCEANQVPADITRTGAQAWVASLLDDGLEATTAHARLKGLRRFCAWLVAEGELAADPLAGIKSPRLDQKVVPALTDGQLRALIKACNGREFGDRRDEAIIRLMAETGLRASEVVGLLTTDVDVIRGQVTIRRAKGNKGRVVPFGPQTGLALDRYLRARRSAGRGDSAALWVGKRAGQWGYYGLRGALKARADAAGIPGFHAHILRHTFATRWKAVQGSDDGLMAIAGWSSRSMIDRYSGAAASQRAADEARGLGLGDL